MNESQRRTMPFSTQTLLLQMSVVLLTVGLFAAAFAFIMVERVTQDAEQRALTLARTLASQPNIREQVAALSALSGTPPIATIEDSPLGAEAEAARSRTQALFVVITDETGIRLTHPDPHRIAEKVSTDPREALAGKEVVTRNTGTLGPSAGAKVPIYAPSAAPETQQGIVGVVSVGFARESLSQAMINSSPAVLVTALGSLVVGFGASMLLRKRLRRLTLGMEPEQLSTLVQDQVAVLETTQEGVIGVNRAGRITVFNKRAQDLLELPDLTGHAWTLSSAPQPLRALTTSGAPDETVIELVTGKRVLVAGARKATHDGDDLGWVLFLRDRTELAQLSRQLESVNAMSSALRAQRHEFANQIHTISGLLEGENLDRARDYVRTIGQLGPLEFPVEGIELLEEPYLQAFVGAKGIVARERGVDLRIGEDTLVRHAVTAPQDVTTVLGNLIDNAINAAVSGGRNPRWVQLDLLDGNDGTLHAVVSDSGDGVKDPGRLFEEGYSASAVPGHGLGLHLARQLAHRRGGELELLDPGSDAGLGAIFRVRLPKALDSDRPLPCGKEGTP